MDSLCSVTTITSLSEVPLEDDCVLVFDLDDTLYAERDFVRSGFQAISRCFVADLQTQVFEKLESYYDEGMRDPLGNVLEQFESDMAKTALLQVYREHQPQIKLASEVEQLLQEYFDAGRQLGIITDGRSVTQRNKIRALGLDRWISEIVISEELGSEKPAASNYQHFEQVFPGKSYVYVGDNLTKDFISPNQLGWTTIALRDHGRNIHPQCWDELADHCRPQFVIDRVA